MARRRNPLARRLAAALTIAFGALARLLPLPLMRGITLLLGRAAIRLVPRVRKVTLENLEHAYAGALSKAEKERILRGAVDNLAHVAAEFTRISTLNRPARRDKITVIGAEHLGGSAGTLCIGAHLGNWEWMAPVMAQQGLRVAEIVRPLDDPWLDRFVETTRASGGVRLVPKDKAAKEILRLLDEGWNVGVLIDQSPRDNAVPATFFGRPCWATAAPVMIALRKRVPVCPVAMYRTGPGRYTLEIQPPLEIVRTGDPRRDILENTQRCQDAIEAMVRAHPEQWLWLHRRWKPRPALEAQWREREARAARRAAKQPGS